MIALNNITKFYNTKPAVTNINLEFEKGYIYGLLGRNGAGKTTIINIITNRIFATEGQVFIGGDNAVENDFAQAKIFSMTEKSSYPSEMKVRDGLKWVKGFYDNFDTQYANKLCKLFNIDTSKSLKALSTGYNSIFKLILTLASTAEIMIFDEPVLGLDANYREIFYKEVLKRFAELNNTIIISTHLIEEISNIVEKIIIIDEGKIIANASTDEIKENAYVVSGNKTKVEEFIKTRKILHTESLGNYLAVTINDKVSSKDLHDAKTLDLEITAPKLQEVFIKLTSKEKLDNE